MREWGLHVDLYADDVVLCIEYKEDLKLMIGSFVGVSRRRGLKVNGDDGVGSGEMIGL